VVGALVVSECDQGVNWPPRRHYGLAQAAAGRSLVFIVEHKDRARTIREVQEILVDPFTISHLGVGLPVCRVFVRFVTHRVRPVLSF